MTKLGTGMVGLETSKTKWSKRIVGLCLTGIVLLAATYAGQPQYGPQNQGRWLKSGDAFYPDCTDPRNLRSMFYSDIPTDPKFLFIARITVIKPIAPAERQYLLDGRSHAGGNKVSALVHIDEVMRGHLDVDEAELMPNVGCLQADYLQTGKSGFVAGRVFQGGGDRHPELWTINPDTRAVMAR